MDTFRIGDILAASDCGTGFAEGYKGTSPLREPEAGVRIVREWPDAKEAVSKVSRDAPRTLRWMQSTRLILSGATGSSPPRPKEKGEYFYTEDSMLVGRTKVNPYLGEAAAVEIEIPFLRRTQGVCEAVYVDGGLHPMSTKEWAEVRMMAALNETLFHRMTGENLLSRFLAPIWEKEDEIDPSPIDPRQQVTNIRLAGIRGKSYGEHCNRTTNASHPNREWRCPIRDQCQPFE